MIIVTANKPHLGNNFYINGISVTICTKFITEVFVHDYSIGLLTIKTLYRYICDRKALVGVIPLLVSTILFFCIKK